MRETEKNICILIEVIMRKRERERGGELYFNRGDHEKEREGEIERETCT